MFTGKLIHLSAFVHNLHYGWNIPLELSDAFLDPWGMCERHVSNSRCAAETGRTRSCGKLQRVRRGGPNPILPYLVSMFVSFTYGRMWTCAHAHSPLAVIAAEVLIDWCFQLKEVLLHRSPDGSLDYPGDDTQHVKRLSGKWTAKPWKRLRLQVSFEAFIFVKMLSVCMICVPHCDTMEALVPSLEPV